MTQLATINLPDNLYWSDEFAWDPVAQQRTTTLTGALIVEEAVRHAGQPVTLEGAWVPRNVVAALKTLAAAPATRHALTLPDGRALTVMFARDERAVDAQPLFNESTPGGSALYRLTLRLIEVSNAD